MRLLADIRPLRESPQLRRLWAGVTLSAVGAAMTGFAVTPWLWPALSLLAVAGAADTATVVLRGTIIQGATPDRLRGRVTAADYVVGAGGGELGNLESGAIGSLASATVRLHRRFISVMSGVSDVGRAAGRNSTLRGSRGA
jgi:hypothetical protein